MEPFEDYLKKKVNYERVKIRRYVHELDERDFAGNRKDFDEYFDRVEEYFKEHGINYEPIYEMEYDYDSDYDDRTYYAMMYVCYERPETDDEMKHRIEVEEKYALRAYQSLENQEEMERARREKKEAEERALYEELKKKYGK